MTDRTQAAPASITDCSLRVAGGRSREGTIPAIPMPADRGMTDGVRGREADDIDAVWARYKAEPTAALRNVIMEHYLPLVHKTAQRLHAKLPATVILDDLFSAGVLGLMDAIESFQVDRHVRFSTFSATRIRGAILDELRSLDWVPRLVRSNAKKLDAAQRELESELGRNPSDEEMADRMRLPVGDYRDMAGDARTVMVTSLSAHRPGDANSADDGQEVGPLPDPKAADPVDESQRRALKAAITKGLSRAERLLVTLYYYENLTMREVGQVLDLSESRVSQMHTQIVKRLRASTAGEAAERALGELAA